MCVFQSFCHNRAICCSLTNRFERERKHNDSFFKTFEKKLKENSERKKKKTNWRNCSSTDRIEKKKKNQRQPTPHQNQFNYTRRDENTHIYIHHKTSFHTGSIEPCRWTFSKLFYWCSFYEIIMLLDGIEWSVQRASERALGPAEDAFDLITCSQALRSAFTNHYYVNNRDFGFSLFILFHFVLFSLSLTLSLSPASFHCYYHYLM